MIGPRQIGVALLVGLGLSVPPMVLTVGGTTGADFGVSHAFGANRIDTATLDIEVGQFVTEMSAETLAPGDKSHLEVELRNVGSLPLVFNMRVLPTDSELAEALTWDQWNGPCDQRPETNGEPEPTNQEVLQETTVLLLGIGERTTACLTVVLPIEAPNELQAAIAEYDVIVDAEHDLQGRSGVESRLGSTTDLGAP